MPAEASGSLAVAADVVALGKPRENVITFIQISGTYASAVLLVEGSLTDSGDLWVPLAAARCDTLVVTAGGTNITPADNATILLSVPSQGCSRVRLRLVSITSGSVAVVINSLPGYSWPFEVNVSSTQDNTVAATMGSPDIRAGSSGAAGTLSVFPATAAKGKLTLTVADQTGDTTVGVVAAEMAAARTITIPDPLGAASVLLGATAVARTATSGGLTTGTIAPAGVLQVVAVTSANANHIIVLPTDGKIVILSVGATGFELRSETPASIAINGGTGADAESAIPANCTVIAIRESSTSWKALQIASDGTVAGVEAAA